MKALLVDGLNLVRRIYAALPEQSKQGHDAESSASAIAGVVTSCTASLRRALNQHLPSHCLVVFDQGGKNWRHELFPDYKKNRAPMPDLLRSALPQLERAFAERGVQCFSLAGYEADDVIATLAVKISEHCAQHDDGHALILSTDRNYCQLLDANHNQNIKVFDHFGQRYIDADMIKKRFQVEPWQLPDLLSLAGDSSVSVPGVKSVGLRTAAKLIGDYGSLEKILKAADDLPGKLGNKLHAGRADAHVAKTLFTLKTNIDLGLNLNQLRYRPSE